LEQMRSLLLQMDEFPLSGYCPHGRPVKLEYSLFEIEKKFGRIV
jgi:DNA mismatch repair protein MutL